MQASFAAGPANVDASHVPKNKMAAIQMREHLKL